MAINSGQRLMWFCICDATLLFRILSKRKQFCSSVWRRRLDIMSSNFLIWEGKWFCLLSKVLSSRRIFGCSRIQGEEDIWVG